ncbi:hypothetical protein IEQ34_005910 [Dendrobium chrysotoxum]|uniref:Uncharacterized protein n=1 Tax=Dendrobium chrysotoxum TaxID=161865 RepID=A0AAV7HA85_DENCH|nr:hypothetical protein IEQ34_005910 [Dendrobium chrysotoxum]
MGLMKKERICCFILLLVLLQLECGRAHVDLFDRLRRLRGGVGVSLRSSQSNARVGGEGREGGQRYDDDEKRTVYTGPNPLHN